MLVHSMLNFINFEFFFNNTGHSRTAWIFITRPEFSIYRSIAIYIIRISKYIYIYFLRPFLIGMTFIENVWRSFKHDDTTLI